MLDIGWQELLVIGALALIVVGPKDLPSMLRSAGHWVGRLRNMARDFQRAMSDAAREADIGNLKELRDLKDTVSGNLDFKAQAAKAQSFLDSTSPNLPSETNKAAKVAEETATQTADDPAGGPVTTPAPLDTPDPAAIGGAAPEEKAPARAAET